MTILQRPTLVQTQGFCLLAPQPLSCQLSIEPFSGFETYRLILREWEGFRLMTDVCLLTVTTPTSDVCLA